ncbi:MAG: phasin family protein [Aphanocapsa lilacina HA4352-LM1]|jgi:polyhydroxyalkanoate synthesis regulator phasin|uniref:Glr3336 protein n=1 Tax=Gloeobacter violaceus (strain ATCC 29082 / PCC 7421) TaxID=251221 RepID=Q7NG37_GLOVI|nr:phasin family protein [Gloeobacter violaceus]MBW4699709.1 phasin family protein [Aphanocapsa lilacina HA4352-LM1]BAC91277.1 glr3336 [Gloeobacter violaceus PCC 7421]
MENNVLKQLLLMGVGATAVITERLQQAVDEWVSDGRLRQEDAKEFLDDLLFRLREEQGNFEEQFRRQIKTVLKEYDVPNQAEIEALKSRLDRIEYQLRQLQERGG